MSYISAKIKDYTVIREVSSSGGQGTVYQAVNSLGAMVAIKILHKHFTANDAFRKHFQKEAMIMASIGHDHIVRALDFYDEGDTVAIIMEYLEGQDLQTYLEQQGEARVVPIPVALKWYSQILPAFAHAHQKGLVHRDVKPSNFFLTTSGNMKVLDFGIARILENTEVGNVNASSGISIFSSAGTPYYKSREHVLRPATVNHLTDVYALGLMFYIMTTGHEPYDIDQITDDILNKELPPVPGYPAAIMKVLLKATAKDRDHRYSDCQVFLSALQEAVANPENATEEVNASAQHSYEEPKDTRSQTLASGTGSWQDTTNRPPLYADSVANTLPDPVTTPPPLRSMYRIYSPTAVAIAAFVGGGFGAGYYMSQNAKRLDGGQNASKILTGWIIAVLVAYLIIPKKTLESSNLFVIALIIQTAAAVLAYFGVEVMQKERTEEHLRLGGTYESVVSMTGLLITFVIIHFTVVFFALVVVHYI